VLYGGCRALTVCALRHTASGRRPASRPRFLHVHLSVVRVRSAMRELVIGLVVLAIYLAGTHGLRPSRSVADGHGRDILSAERWLHASPEEPLNSWLSGHHTLGTIFAWEYALVYVLTTFGVIGFLWYRQNPFYWWCRDVFIVTTVLAIGCFALWPTTPPRLLPGETFVDIVAQNHPFLSWGSSAVSAANTLAAMPSLHVAWAVWVSVALWQARELRWLEVAGVLHVGLTVLVILATGNHYWLDAVGGLVIVLVSAALVTASGRLNARRRRRRRGRSGTGSADGTVEASAVPSQPTSATPVGTVGGADLLTRGGRADQTDRADHSVQADHSAHSEHSVRADGTDRTATADQADDLGELAELTELDTVTKAGELDGAERPW
jgi:hypothetical protein